MDPEDPRSSRLEQQGQKDKNQFTKKSYNQDGEGLHHYAFFFTGGGGGGGGVCIHKM